MVGGLSIAVACLATSCSSDGDVSETDSPSAVTIEFEIDISVEPNVGPFEVTDGAEALGCDAGTATVRPGPSPEVVENLMECDGGTITVHFDAVRDPNDENLQTGPWNVVEGTGDFEELEGGGEMVSVVDREALAVDMTLTGEASNN